MREVIRAPAFGTRLRKEAEVRPKPMMEISGCLIVYNRCSEYMWCKGTPLLSAES